jgi:hypothetical protein
VEDYSDRFNVSRLLLIWLLFYELKWDCCSCYYLVDVWRCDSFRRVTTLCFIICILPAEKIRGDEGA